jgi:hypothetical protein
LREAIDEQSERVKNMRRAYRTIDDGLQDGKASPLKFEFEQAQRPGDII